MTPAEREALATALLDTAEGMEPIIEAAEGQRKKMEERGWSPTAAEAYSLELLIGMVRATFRGGK